MTATYKAEAQPSCHECQVGRHHLCPVVITYYPPSRGRCRCDLRMHVAPMTEDELSTIAHRSILEYPMRMPARRLWATLVERGALN